MREREGLTRFWKKGEGERAQIIFGKERVWQKKWLKERKEGLRLRYLRAVERAHRRFAHGDAWHALRCARGGAWGATQARRSC